MLKWILSLVDRIFAVIGALFFSQIPAFVQQYMQQLAGHVAELHFQVNAIYQVALQSNKTLNQYVQKFLSNSDPDFVKQGEIMQAMIQRSDQLSNSLIQLHESTFLTRSFVFLRYYDWEIVKSTSKLFQISIPLSIEGIIYALIGIIVGFLLFFSIRKLFESFINLFRRSPSQKNSS